MESSRQLHELNAIYMESVAKTAGEKLEKMEKDDDAAGAPNAKKKKVKRWWDDDGDGIGYEKGEVKKEGYQRDPEQSKKDRTHSKQPDPSKDGFTGIGNMSIADIKKMNSRMKKEEYTVTAADKKGNTPAYQGYKAGKKNVKTGKPLYKAADHLKNEHHEKDANGNTIPHTDLQEKQKDTPDQVKAVIAFDKARKGTDDATYDSEHGKKKQAKKERDYAKWQRDKGAEDAQKSGHPWEHAKGSTREKEGKKSEKHAHIKDSYDHQIHSTSIQGYANAYEAVYENWSGNEQNELATKEIKDLQKAAKTGKGKYVAKADKVAEETLSASGKFSAEEIDAIVEAERKLADRLHRKRKLYDRTVPKAMEYARREGEAAGHARYRMGQLSREMDKVKDKMNKEK